VALECQRVSDQKWRQFFERVFVSQTRPMKAILS